MAEGTFATAINCMDGRVQLPVIEYLKNKLGVDYVDMITEPGPIKYLAENNDKTTVESIRKRVEISAVKHGSKVVAIVGHDDCAGNPVERDIQLEQIKKSIELAKSWGFAVQLLSLYVNERWEVEEI
ncbi:MAG TPA: hypothetical protein ENL22_04595 [candidate division Zixibacteria bacterium]|nr:hypothetical protein [candidate division Zixibacteria bacterium]